MYFNILQPLVCKMVTRLHRQSFGRSSTLSENAHNSWTAWYILFKFCNRVLMYFEHCLATDMQNVDEASPSIILAGLALLMKMRITLERRGIFLLKFCILLFFNTVQPLVCETVTRLHRASILPARLLVKMLKTLGPHGVF